MVIIWLEAARASPVDTFSVILLIRDLGNTPTDSHATCTCTQQRGETKTYNNVSGFFDRLKTEVPRLPGHKYIFAMDTNNVTDDTLDYWHREGEPNSVDRSDGCTIHAVYTG